MPFQSGSIDKNGLARTPDGKLYVTLGSGSVINSPTFTGTADFEGDITADGWVSLMDGLPVAWNSTSASKYRSPGYAGAINVETSDGRIAFYTAPSGALDGAITFAERLALTQDGAVKALGHFASPAPVTETAATHTVANTTTYLIADRAGAITVTLPSAATFPGRQIWVRTIQAQQVDSASSNVVPRAGGAAGTAILGAVDGAWALLVSDGTNWQIMASS